MSSCQDYVVIKLGRKGELRIHYSLHRESSSKEQRFAIFSSFFHLLPLFPSCDSLFLFHVFPEAPCLQPAASVGSPLGSAAWIKKLGSCCQWKCYLRLCLVIQSALPSFNTLRHLCGRRVWTGKDTSPFWSPCSQHFTISLPHSSLYVSGAVTRTIEEVPNT